MEVLIAGAHGKVARHLTRLLAAGGDTARGLIRNPAHAPDLEADGGIAVLCDLPVGAGDEDLHIEASVTGTRPSCERLRARSHKEVV